MFQRILVACDGSDGRLLPGVPEKHLASADLPVLVVGERNGNRARIGARA